MECLLGRVCLSTFRKKQMLKTMAKEGGFTEFEAYEIFLFKVNEPLNDDESHKIKALLHAADTPQNEHKKTIYISPRIGTISPWSSKATDILHHCGLTKIERIERVVMFQWPEEVNQEDIEILAQSILDPMTESLITQFNDLEAIFFELKPQTFKEIHVMTEGLSALAQANKKYGLALSDIEMNYLLEQYQSRLKRNPSDVELMMFAQANSEHCRHKIFNAQWTIDEKPQQQSLFAMIKNTYENYSEGILTAYNDNGAVLTNRFDASVFINDPHTHLYCKKDHAVHTVIKVETHNHPTAIAPHPGAATGNGGEIRDEAATGRGAKTKAGLTGFSVSNLRIPNFTHEWEQDYGKPTHIASALEIMLKAPIGGASFNNEFGRPNLCGYFRSYEQTIFNERKGYHKPIMIAGGMGNILDANVKKGKIFNAAKIIVLGGPAMNIGLGGGAASSMASGSSEQALDYASVQRENPEMQRRAQEVINQCWALGSKNPILSIHDVGAGGLSNAVPEIIHDASMGGEFELREISNAEPGMAPLAIWCNEAQERYVLALQADSLALFEGFAKRERCPYSIIGEATLKPHLLLKDKAYNNQPIDLPMDVLFGKLPKMQRQGTSQSPRDCQFETSLIDIKEAAYRVLRHPTVASKEFLITIADRTVGGLTARDQMVGPWQIPVSDCAVTALDFEGYRGEAMAMGERTPIATMDAAAAAKMAVGEAITNIAAASIVKLSDIKLSANWMAACGNPKEDAALYAAVKAVGEELCPSLNIAIPVGKDSLSMKSTWKAGNEEKTVSSPVSLIISAFAPVDDITKTLSPQLKTDQGETDLLLIDLGQKQNRLGGSIVSEVYNAQDSRVPNVDNPALLSHFFAAVQELKQKELILAYHDRSDGGLFVTLAEMCFAGHCGLNVLLNDLGDDLLQILFNEELGAVLQVTHNNVETVLEILAKYKLQVCTHILGVRNDLDKLNIYYDSQLVFSESRQALQTAWTETSYQMQALRDNPQCAQQAFAGVQEDDPGLYAKVTFDLEEINHGPTFNLNSPPKVAILREQGINGHIEMAKAFELAGFQAYDVHMTDLLENRFNLDEFEGLVVPGGFSYGDVLGAGQGWAKSILFHDKLRKQFQSFFDNKNHFALGVCNGCQMLSQLKSIIPGAELWPEFKRNLSEQFEARFTMVKIHKTQSIFFQAMEGCELPIVVSHGEGKAQFLSIEEEHQAIEKNLICMQYLDNYGKTALHYPQNPNGSPEAITALTNSDGRITIMMPHPERIIRTCMNSWYPNDWGPLSPWFKMFKNAKRFLD